MAILTGLTGYVPQSNYDGQWIGQQAKEATNAIGMGGLLNLMDLNIVTGGTRARGLGCDAGVDAGGVAL